MPRDQGFAAGRISLRSASLDSVAVIDSTSGEMLGTVEAERAFSTIHPGAVYLHMGRSYEVRELDVDGRRAIVEPFDGDWYTQPKKETNVYIDAIGRKAEPGGIHRGVELYTGEVSVSEQVIAYQRKTVKDQEVIDLIALNLPEQNFSDAGALVRPARTSSRGPRRSRPRSSSARSTPPSTRRSPCCRCWRCATAGTSAGFRPTSTSRPGGPTIFIYDGHPGGVGIAERGFERFPELVGNALRLVSECPCASGCPSCVQSPKCGNLNEPLHKAGAIELMGGILGRRARAPPRHALMHRRFAGRADGRARVPGGSVRAAVAEAFACACSG